MPLGADFEEEDPDMVTERWFFTEGQRPLRRKGGGSAQCRGTGQESALIVQSTAGLIEDGVWAELLSK